MGKFYSTLIIVLMGSTVFSQEFEKRSLYYGNQAFDEKDYDGAIAYYEEAINESPLSFKPNFNMANAYFRKNDFQKAADLYGSIIDLAPTAYDRSKVYHNLGNSYFMNQQLDDAIDAYKSALKLNPGDEDSRYNLAYALLMKQKQEEQQNQQQQQNQNENQSENQNGNENQDENEGQDGNQSENQNQNENQQGSGEGDGDREENQQPATQPRISKDQAKRILEAALKSEKSTRQKMDKHKVVGTGESRKKDW